MNRPCSYEASRPIAEPNLIGRQVLGAVLPDIRLGTGRRAVGRIRGKSVELMGPNALGQGVVYWVHFTPTTTLLY